MRIRLQLLANQNWRSNGCYQSLACAPGSGYEDVFNCIAIQLCRPAHAIFSPKFWNDKMNFARVFVTVSPRRPWHRLTAKALGPRYSQLNAGYICALIGPKLSKLPGPLVLFHQNGVHDIDSQERRN